MPAPRSLKKYGETPMTVFRHRHLNHSGEGEENNQ
jgi:hypothetical protein